MGATTSSNSERHSGGFSEPVSKVPAATAVFWITKALTTAMGESSSDFLVHRFPPVAAVVVGFVAFCAALTLQFRASRYIPWIYWLTVAMVGVFGTMAADVLHVGLGVPYAVSTACFIVVLAGIFTTWYALERHSRSTASHQFAERSSIGSPSLRRLLSARRSGT